MAADAAHVAIPRRLWLAWEVQRRSETLAEYFGAEYVRLVLDLPRIVKYPILVLRTLWTIARRRPDIVYVQNPSIFLAALVCWMRPAFGYVVVMDRHSNFFFETRDSRSFKWRLFHAVSRYSNRHADLTIVTNDFLKSVVEQEGGSALVLQDRLPTMQATAQPQLKRPAGVFICTFSADEPVDTVIEAAALSKSAAHLYVTGRAKLTPSRRSLIERSAERVTLTGFLSEDAYKGLVASADFAIVLTTRDHTLVCGAYEALQCGKPVILSDTAALREYFREGTRFSELTPIALAAAIDDVVRNLSDYRQAAARQKQWMTADWSSRCDGLSARVDALLRKRRASVA